MTDAPPVGQGGTLTLGDEIEIHRLGYGAMQLPGEGVWGEPEDRDAALAVLRRALELGVDFIDTADSYGPDVSEELIAEALHPYPEDLVIATKAGLTRPGPGQWKPDGRPEHLRSACEGSLRRLKLDTIDLFQLHRIDSKVPAEEQIGTLTELRDEGKIRLIGLSEVDAEALESVQSMTPVASVQNRYNLADREWEPMVERCTDEGIAFLPWFPLATGKLARPGGPVDALAEKYDATPSQVALAWLLHRSPVMVPIPGTSSIGHLEDNCGGATLELADEDMASLEDA